jgi:Sulfotransferase family
VIIIRKKGWPPQGPLILRSRKDNKKNNNDDVSSSNTNIISPYEQRTGGETWSWARKLPPYQDTVAMEQKLAQNKDNKNKKLGNKDVCFVHVGKTAGSTLGCLLGFDYGECETTKTVTHGRLAPATTRVFHNDMNDCFDDMDVYLVAVRNPFARLLSWFNYERPADYDDPDGYLIKLRKPLFVRCRYYTLHQLAEDGLAHNGSATEKCRDRARQAVRGDALHIRHNYYNFGFYVAALPPGATVAVLRTEFLTTDWNSVERYLGATRTPVLEAVPRVNLTPDRKKSDNVFSPRARALLCYYLCEEIKVYQWLLNQAVNLNASQVETSMHDMSATCPVQAAQKKCPDIYAVPTNL